MSIGILRAIPTIYKGVRLKSRLEGDVAFLIDNLGYEWLYEPQSYLLENGIHYLPDFYLPKLKLFIECRGYETDKGEAQISGFAKMIADGKIGQDLIKQPKIPQGVCNEHIDYFVIGPDKCTFYECTVRYGVSKNEDVTLCECKKCKRWFFVGTIGSYQCRNCGEWDGDNHISDMRWLWYTDALLIGYRQTTVREFIDELNLWLR